MDFIDLRKLPLGATPERVIEILPLLAGFVERQWAFPRIEDLEMIDKILDLNGLSVDDAIDQLGTVCSDFLLVCYFAGKKFPCFQVLLFLKNNDIKICILFLETQIHNFHRILLVSWSLLLIQLQPEK